jgi:hypothetical protein
VPISRHEENMEKKSAKNCTLYHVVNKSVWADIGAANILVLTGLQHQYIGAVQGEQNCLQHHAYLV